MQTNRNGMVDGLVGGSFVLKFKSNYQVELCGVAGYVTIIPGNDPSKNNGSVISVVLGEEVGNAFRMGFKDRRSKPGVSRG